MARKVMIIGCGRVGSMVARTLVAQGDEVTILDTDAEVADNQSLYQLLNRGATGNLIVLGTARPGQKKLRGDRVYGKPYHFGPLIRTIELLCSEPQATEM